MPIDFSADLIYNIITAPAPTTLHIVCLWKTRHYIQCFTMIGEPVFRTCLMSFALFRSEVTIWYSTYIITKGVRRNDNKDNQARRKRSAVQYRKDREGSLQGSRSRRRTRLQHRDGHRLRGREPARKELRNRLQADSRTDTGHSRKGPCEARSRPHREGIHTLSRRAHQSPRDELEADEDL